MEKNHHQSKRTTLRIQLKPLTSKIVHQCREINYFLPIDPIKISKGIERRQERIRNDIESKSFEISRRELNKNQARKVRMSEVQSRDIISHYHSYKKNFVKSEDIEQYSSRNRNLPDVLSRVFDILVKTNRTKATLPKLKIQKIDPYLTRSIALDKRKRGPLLSSNRKSSRKNPIKSVRK